MSNKVPVGVAVKTFVTPEMAADFLSRAAGQRPVGPSHVTFLAAEIAEDRWETNNDMITFANDGSLNNGQHRCHAIIKADKGAWIYVAEGLSTKAFAKMDTPRRRSGADMIALAGGANYAITAAIVHLFVAYDNEAIDRRGWDRLSNDELFKAYKDNKDAVDASAAISRGVLRALGLGNGAVLGGAHYIFSRLDPELANRFVETVKTPGVWGIPNAEDLHLALLRRGKGRRSEAENLAVLIKAWNRHRTGAPRPGSRAVTYFRAAGKQLERFPRAI